MRKKGKAPFAPYRIVKEEKLMTKDIICRGLLCDDRVNFIAISGAEMIEKARNTHVLSRVCTAALGRTLLCCCMMGAQMKSATDRVTVLVKGGGPAGNIVCTAWNEGRDAIVKGYIENPELELPLGPDGKLDVSSAVGWYGDLVVTRSLSLKEPYVGHSPMVSGEIAEDFAQYFTVSEQQPSLVYLGVHVAAQDGRVLSAGGIIIQPLPGCPDSVIDELQAKTDGIKAMAGMLETMELKEVLSKLLAGTDMRITEEVSPYYRCDCSRERLEQVLISLGENELKDMIEKENKAEIKCHFCNSAYEFDAADLQRLLSEAKGEK